MGGLVSRPLAADKLSTAPAKYDKRFSKLNARSLSAPFLVVTLSAIFYLYARTSIQAAKLNAQRHREADGGQISWQRESQRRHGQRERPSRDSGLFREALMEDFGGREHRRKEEDVEGQTERSGNADRSRNAVGRDNGRGDSSGSDGGSVGRSITEQVRERYKDG